MKKARSCSNWHRPSSGQPPKSEAQRKPSLMPCQKFPRNFEQLYREDHQINQRYQSELLAKINAYEKAALHSQKNYDKLARKYDTLNKQFQRNLKFTSTVLKKLQHSVHQNKKLRGKFEEVENVKEVLLKSVRDNQVGFKEADRLFYEQKIEELRQFYRSTLGKAIDGARPETVKSGTMPNMNSPEPMIKNRDFLSTRDDFMNRTAQSSLGFRATSGGLVAKNRATEQMDNIKSQINFIEQQIGQMKSKVSFK
jgi:hypothetical protein